MWVMWTAYPSPAGLTDHHGLSSAGMTIDGFAQLCSKYFLKLSASDSDVSSAMLFSRSSAILSSSSTLNVRDAVLGPQPTTTRPISAAAAARRTRVPCIWNLQGWNELP